MFSLPILINLGQSAHEFKRVYAVGTYSTSLVLMICRIKCIVKWVLMKAEVITVICEHDSPTPSNTQLHLQGNFLIIGVID